MPASTDPSFWFLSSRGNTDTNVSLYTSGNKVEALVDGASYMQMLHYLIIGTDSGDYIFIAGWHLRPDLRLVGAKTVVKVLGDAAARGVVLRVLLSCHEPGWNYDACSELAKLPNTLTVLDARFDFLGSAHQKIAIISKKGSLHAFCGGIDLTYDRGDNSLHSMPPSQRQSVDYPGGWHDVHSYVQGPAAADIDETFRERWRNRQRAAFVQYTPPISILNWPIDGLVAPPTPTVGKHHVQMLRTYSCNYGYPFAKKGEFSARRAVLKAIGLASDYIYIEDQYFYSSEIADALVSVLKARPQLRVIVVVPREPTADKLPASANFYQQRAINRLVNGLASTAAAGSFAFYSLRNVDANPAPADPQVYVHAKVIIVDDVWVEIGSMNCNIRSMTHDIEAGVAVVDGETFPTNKGLVCKFARDLRLRLWAEHLGLLESDPDLQDPVAAYDTWKKRAGNAKVRAVPHHTSSNQHHSLGPGPWLSFVDPQGSCSGTPKISAP